MASTQKTIAAADIGYGSVKAMLNRQDAIHFPSGSAPAKDVPVHLAGSHAVPLDVNGVPYLAGFEQEFSSHERHQAGYFARSADYHALFLETLDRLGEKDIDTLVLGLPSKEFDTDTKTYLKDTFTGLHHVRGTDYSIGKISVADQPLGTAALYYQDNQSSLNRERMLVIDIGYGTCDIAMIVRGAVDRSASMSFNIAMRNVCEAVARDLSTATAEFTANWVDERLRDGEFDIDTRGIKANLLEAAAGHAASAAEAIVRSTLGRIGSFTNIAEIVVTGGGAMVMGPCLEKLIQGPLVVVMDSPVTANLRGFVAMAEARG